MKQSTVLLLSLIAAAVAMPSVHAQVPGCTDPQALNYDPNAGINDGSCIYPLTNAAPTLLANLAPTVRETSGLGLLGGMLWTHNDSGHPPHLFALDTLDGTILRQVTLINASNVDWEDLAQSDTHLFIGDVGNNNGQRTNLRIYRVGLDSLLHGVSNTVFADTIAFHYPDQTDFSSKPNNNEYDCEAMFFRDDTLHLFTKNWVSLTTRYYTLPSTPGTYTATLRDSFSADGLITGAAIHPEGDVIVLCGYKPIGFGLYTCFAWLLWDYPPHTPFGGHKRRIEWGTPLQLAQLEAVWLQPSLTGWITGEAISAGPLSIPARLHRFDIGPYISPNTTATDRIYALPATWTVYPNPSAGILYVQQDGRSAVRRIWLSDTAGRRLPVHVPIAEPTIELDISTLPPGLYFLHIEDETGRSVLKVVRS